MQKARKGGRKHDTHLIVLQNGIEYQVLHGPTCTDSEFQSGIKDGCPKGIRISGVSGIASALRTGTDKCGGCHGYRKRRALVVAVGEEKVERAPSMNRNESSSVDPNEIDVGGARVATPGVVEQVVSSRKRKKKGQ